MPLYEYQCDTCGRRVEVIVKFSDPPLEKCPSCGGPVHKLLSSPAIQFKGTGFYITDYAKKDQMALAKSGDSETKTAASEKVEKSDKAEKSDKGDKGSATTESTSSSPSASTKNNT